MPPFGRWALPTRTRTLDRRTGCGGNPVRQGVTNSTGSTGKSRAGAIVVADEGCDEVDNTPMSDDAPLYVPREFEREHLEEARRSVASASKGQGVAHRVMSMVRRSGSAQRRRSIGLAILLHGLAALLVLTISAVTGTWLIGLTVVGFVALSLFGSVRLLQHLHESRHPEGPTR